MAGSSSFPSSSSRRWDVFLSFRGEDIRKTFIDHLYTALDRAGIQTFKDNPELRKGEEISPALLNAIQDSKMSIVVFSKNYAFSRWCLDELVKILECMRTKGQIVHPVFYDVHPLEVRHQLGSFAEAIEKHKLRSMDEAKIWRDALTEASNLSGYNLKNDANGHESSLIQKIMKNVLQEVNPKVVIVAEHLVAMDSRVKDIYEKISIGSSNVRVIGIYGMGGVGKTTIAKAFYNKYFHHFERSSFLENVREASQGYNGPLSLVKQLISELLDKQGVKVANVERGVSFLKERVRTKKVLIVLDDLDQSSQLKLLIRCWNFFGPESRIIITTRDARLLDEFEKIDEGFMVMPYMVKTLDKDESLELLSYHAFGGTISEDFRKILERIVSYTGGLPLALEVLGSFLFRRTKVEWTSTLEKLQQFPNNQIQTILKISYDALDHIQKKIFLDIAFCLVGMDKEEANHIFDSSRFYPPIGIKVLEERCLLTIDWENKFRMHDLIRDMGREIVREESIEPGERSRLWYQEEVCDVLKKQKGTIKIEAISLDLNTSGQDFNTKTFGSMPNLRLLQINNVHLIGSFENSFEELRWLCWRYCPLTCLPPSFHPPNLVSLDIQSSNVITLWDGPKPLKSLKILNASHSPSLSTTPDFGEVKMLEKLFLRDCPSLVRVHPSVGVLGKLVHLDLRNCSNLKRLPEQFGSMEGLQMLDVSGIGIEQLPDSIGHMARLVKLNLGHCISLRSLPNSICNLSSLEELDLDDCVKLVGLPVELGNMKSLRRLKARNTAIEQLPDSVGHLSRLVYLTLKSCKNLRNLPNSICNMSSLERLDLQDCVKLVGLPVELGNLKSLCWLVARNTAIEQLPDSVGHLSELFSLRLNSCKNLRNLPNSICNLSSLEELDLDDCVKLVGLPVELGNMKSLQRLRACNTAIEQLPDSVGHLSRLLSLKLDNCKNLRNLPNSICNLSSLEELDLDDCVKLVGLPVKLGNMKSLQRHNAHNTAIEQLPDSVGHLSRLLSLKLDNCKNIKNLPNSICNLSSLEELDLDDCVKLVGLPVELGNMKSLQRLKAYNTAIEQLPDSVGHLSRLLSLKLDNCKNIRNLPNSICNLSSLEELDLDDCVKLVGLPMELGNMKSLRRLQASNTAIEQLPDSVGLLSRLVTLKLSSCKNLRNLPNSICNLSSLKELSLFGCFRLVGLPVELGNMKSLQSLLASDTAIEQLPDSVGHLSRLVILELDNCKNLINLPNSICNLRSLETLGMGGCLNLKNLPEPLGNLELLFGLRIIVGSIDRLPDSIGLLKKLRYLSIEECNMRGGVLPDEIGSLSSQSFVGESFRSLLSQLVNLTHLRLINCTSLQSLPKLPLNLQDLVIRGCTSIKQLPNLSSLEYLESLFLKNCSSLESLPDLPPDLRNLYATSCISLKTVSNLSALKKLEWLDLTNCRNLRITIKESFLQGLLDRRDSYYSIIFPSGAIPDWFSHQRTGCSVSFDMPPNLVNNFIGMVLWAVYSSNRNNNNSYIHPIISNKTDGNKNQLYMGFTTPCEVHSWVCYIGKPISMKSQDRIEVVFRGGVNVKVERCGVYLLHNNTSTQMGRKRGRDMDDSETISHLKRLKLWISDVSETISPLKRLKSILRKQFGYE